MSPKPVILARFGKLIRRRRLELGWSQEDFALRIGFHRTYIGSIERGERNVTLLKLLQITEALELNLIEFVKVILSD